MYSEKATKFFKISTVDLSYVVPVKSAVEISQNVVAFSDHKNFNGFFINHQIFLFVLLELYHTTRPAYDFRS